MSLFLASFNILGKIWSGPGVLLVFMLLIARDISFSCNTHVYNSVSLLYIWRVERFNELFSSLKTDAKYSFNTLAITNSSSACSPFAVDRGPIVEVSTFFFSNITVKFFRIQFSWACYMEFNILFLFPYKFFCDTSYYMVFNGRGAFSRIHYLSSDNAELKQ